MSLINEMKMYSAGDLIQFDINAIKFYGEIVGIADDGKIEVSRLKKTEKQEGRIWQFADDDAWSAIESSYIQKHIKVNDSAKRSVVVKAWREIGFLPGGDGITFCRVEDEELSTLPLYGGDSSSDESGSSDESDEPVSSNPAMHGYASDGFVVPDDEGSDFEFAELDELDEEAAKFVRDTHQAVRDFDNWEPTDKQGKAIKAFVERADKKASIETDNKRFEAGKSSISTSKPPIKKRKR